MAHDGKGAAAGRRPRRSRGGDAAAASERVGGLDADPAAALAAVARTRRRDACAAHPHTLCGGTQPRVEILLISFGVPSAPGLP
jgi:hypothetical protein